MSDDFSLGDALSGQGNAANQQTQNQNLNNPWGGQNPGVPGQPGFPGQQYPGFPGQGQQYPGFPGAGQEQGQGQGQQYPGFPGPGQGQQYPGFPAGGQQYPGFPAAGQQYPGFPGPGQSYPGAPPAGPGQSYPGAPPAGPGQSYPGAPPAGPGQSYPGAPAPGQGPTNPQQTLPSIPPGPMKVPCEIPLPSGCTDGLMFTLNGIPTGNRFTIDFKEGSDIVFHLNPRFDERPNVVVRNTMIRGVWGKEERQCPKFPFQQGQPFKLQILFTRDNYKVAVNNENLCQYQHRAKNFSGIKCIRIEGGVTVSNATLSTV